MTRHAPGAPATVDLDLTSDPGRLTVRNPLPAGFDGSRRDAGGSGIAGMGQRAGLLGASLEAGPREGQWVVEVVLPRGETAGEPAGSTCPLPRLSRGLPWTSPA